MTLHRKIATALAIASLAGGGLAACGTATQHAGYFNMTTLASGEQTAIQQTFAQEQNTGTISSVSCFLTGSQTAMCHVAGTDSAGTPMQTNVAVHISVDGQSFANGG